MMLPEIVDLHMHTNVSDGTDTPEEIISKVEQAGIQLFSVTDHDAIRASSIIKENLKTRKTDLRFVTGIEFSCRDKQGKYHILGYHYDETAPSMTTAAAKAHAVRMKKLDIRLAFIEEKFGFTFSEEDLEELHQNSNPGKPHIANLMIKYGYASSIKEAMEKYLNKKKITDAYTLPQDAIKAIKAGGGIPVLAHPSFGDGDQLITGDEMDARLKHLLDMGLEGVEAYYSGFTPKLTAEMLRFAERYDLYITAGSDYHGKNKIVRLLDTNLESTRDAADGMKRFLETVLASE